MWELLLSIEEVLTSLEGGTYILGGKYLHTLRGTYVPWLVNKSFYLKYAQTFWFKKYTSIFVSYKTDYIKHFTKGFDFILQFIVTFRSDAYILITIKISFLSWCVLKWEKLCVTFLVAQTGHMAENIKRLQEFHLLSDYFLLSILIH